MSAPEPGAEVAQSPAWLVRARERVAAFRALGIEVAAIADRLDQAEVADAAGNTEQAEDLCDEIAVLTALVTREVKRAVGTSLPGAADTPVDAVPGAAAVAEAITPAEDTLAAQVEAAVRDAVRVAEDTWRSAVIAEVETRVGDKLADARERWASAVLEQALTALDEKIAALPAPEPAPAAAPAQPPADMVTMNVLRKEIAKALELHEPAAPPPPPSAPAPEKVGELAISEESVLALANTGAFKELLEDRFSVMLRYIRDEVLPKALKRATGEAARPEAKEPAESAPQKKPKPKTQATKPKPRPKAKAPTPKPKKKG